MSGYLLCENVELRVGYNILISSFSLALGASQSIALIGPNGCGKTSLLRVLAGISRPHNGIITVLGEQLWPANKIKHEHLSVFMSNIPALLMDQSVLWNLEFYSNTYGNKYSNHEYKNALFKVGLSGRENQPTRTLSTGQKRRLTLASLLLIKPNIILADEPTNGLDSSGSDLCLSIFAELCDKNKSSIIVATHDTFISNWCQKKVLLENYIPKTKLIKNKVRVLL